MADKDLMQEVERQFNEVSNCVIGRHMKFILLNVWKMKFRGPITGKKLRRRGIYYVFDLETEVNRVDVALGNKKTGQVEPIWPFTAERQKEYGTWLLHQQTIRHMQHLAMTGL